MIIKKLFLIIFLCLFLYLSADEVLPDSTYSIQGRVTFTKNIPVTVTCLTEIEFEEELPAKYFYVKELTDLDRELGYIDYQITGIPAGEYLIFAFQDKNENDKLDRILIVPKEPWAIYGLPRPTTGKPDFSELNLTIDHDLEALNMNLKKGL